jgi:hypothetical protein
MKRSLFAVPVLAFALALCASAWAGSSTYYSSSYWQAGQGSSSSFSSSWWQNIMSKTGSFDSTIAFIDNTSYSWHSTLRGPGTYLSTHWLSSQVKKAHCRANVAAAAHGSCTAVN